MLTISYFSWRYVETPFRNSKAIDTKLLLVSLIIVYSILAALAVTIKRGHGLVNRIKLPYELTDSQIEANYSQDCSAVIDGKKWHLLQKNGKYVSVPICKIGNLKAKTSVFLLGDSHVDAVAYGFDLIAKTKKVALEKLSLSGCPGLLNVDVLDGFFYRDVCRRVANSAFEYVKDHNIKTVFMIARWSLYTNGSYTGNEIYLLSKENSNLSSTEKSRINFQEALLTTAKAYRNIGVDLIVLAQVPEQKIDVKKAYYKILKIDAESERNSQIDQLSVKHYEHNSLQEFNRQIFKAYEKRGLLTFLEIDDLFCDLQRCEIGTAQVPYYKDTNHLSAFGARQLFTHIESKRRLSSLFVDE